MLRLFGRLLLRQLLVNRLALYRVPKGRLLTHRLLLPLKGIPSFGLGKIPLVGL
jgi:hypothetical protein